MSSSYRTQITNKIKLFLSKSVYNNSDELLVKLKEVSNLNLDKYTILGLRLLLKYLRANELLEDKDISRIESYLKNKRSNADLFVPSDLQIKETLSKLSSEYQELYKIFLFSGMRITEIEEFLEHRKDMKQVRFEIFTRYEMNWNRGKKNSFWLYLPNFIEIDSNVSIEGLKSYLKRNDLIALKYSRKWFYTKCIELGVPESIADFYEGRTSSSVGAKHYLSKLSLADKFYDEKLIIILRKF